MVLKPSEKEQEYFLRLEVERIQKLREDHQKKLAEGEKKRLKELHYMHCPKCGMDMTVANLAGVEVDVCPDCRGMYLDAGELDKILEDKRRSRILDTIATVRRFLKS
jgi:hypothetical protein